MTHPTETITTTPAAESVVSVAPRAAILGEIAAERTAQDRRWGEQNHPDGTGGARIRGKAERARARCQQLAADGAVTWRVILREEVYEAFAEHDPARLRAELVQVAAVAACWVEAIDRRGPTTVVGEA